MLPWPAPIPWYPIHYLLSTICNPCYFISTFLKSRCTVEHSWSYPGIIICNMEFPTGEKRGHDSKQIKELVICAGSTISICRCFLLAHTTSKHPTVQCTLFRQIYLSICPTVKWRSLCTVGVYCNQRGAAFRAISPETHVFVYPCVCVFTNVCEYVWLFFGVQVTVWPTLKSNYKPKNVTGISITIVDLAR